MKHRVQFLLDIEFFQEVILDSWAEILAKLQTNYKDKAKVVVIPDGTLQYFPHSSLPPGTTISAD